MNGFEGLVVTVGPQETVDATFRKMASLSKKVAHAGIAIVVDENRHVLGVLTDGDIRRAYTSEAGFSAPVSAVMVRDPITVPSTLPSEDLMGEVYRRVRRTGRLTSASVRHVLVVDEGNHLVDVLDFLQLLTEADYRSASVAIYGMGYVGLTLAAALSSRGHDVCGIDARADLVKALSDGISHVLEPGLEDMLRVNLGRGSMSFSTSVGQRQHGVYVVAVGTPVDTAGHPNLEALKSVAGSIGNVLKRGDLIMLRSTVPAGATRREFLPLVEARSGLKAGADFQLAFTPERTVEGNALSELRTLPQIVGGLTSRCTRRAAEFWSTLTASVIRMPSLEAAEIVKLANNTYRDLSFAFANELALLSDGENLNAFEIIRAANEGYPRSRIPLPSPGVGGYCLTKDPLLFSVGFEADGYKPTLGRASRSINERAAAYPVDIVKRYAARRDMRLCDLKVLLVGVAFKGEPETTDMRESVSLHVARTLSSMAVDVTVWDAVVPAESLRTEGLAPAADLATAAAAADAILILNNHRRNVQPGFLVQKGSRGRLIFDGWSLLDASEVERMRGYVYATMGYMTPETRVDRDPKTLSQ